MAVKTHGFKTDSLNINLYFLLKSFYSQLKENIGVDTLFNLAMVNRVFRSLTPGAIKEEMSRLAKKEKVKRLGYGVYVIDSGKLSEEELQKKSIVFRYIGSSQDVIGFYYGENFVREVKGTSLLETGLEIVTNKATSGKKAIFQFGRRIILRKPYVKVTTSNVRLVSFLTYIGYASEDELKRNNAILANYVREYRLSAIEAVAVLPNFPSKTAKRLLSSGFYKLMWKH